MGFYQSKAWRGLLDVLKTERVTQDGILLCEHCGKPIVHKYDCIGHHVIPLNESNINDASIALNPDNIMLVHHVCHNRIHNKLGLFTKQVYLVWGSPLSGKTTWVNEVKEYGDLVIDMDSIWQCISGCNRYDKPDRLKGVAFGVRDTLIEMVKYRRGNWRNAYVIGGYPLSGERERLIKVLGARDVFIDCEYEECMERLKRCENRNTGEWKKYVNDWWRKSGNTPPRSRNEQRRGNCCEGLKIRRNEKIEIFRLEN